MADIQVIIIKDGKSDSLSLSELKKALGLTDTPPVVDNKPPVVVDPKPVYGFPRKQVGISAQGLAVLVLTGVPGIWLQINGNPDAIASRGTNLPYTSLPGVPRPTGADTNANGNAPQPGVSQPAGYETLYFDAAKKEPYYRQSATSSGDVSTTDGKLILSATHVNLNPNAAQ